MRFYNQQHEFYCGIDLHARKMYVCITDQAGKTMLYQNLKTDPELLFDTIFPFLKIFRRRTYMVRQCGLLLGHIQNTNTQYNLPAFGKKICRKYNRDGVSERFDEPAVKAPVDADLAMIDAFNRQIKQLEWQIEKAARQHNYHDLYLLRSIPGVGQILALVILYEVQDIKRFGSAQRFCSYSRLIRPEKESDGKWADKSNKKIGNAHLKWAIKDAAMLFLRESDQAKQHV